MSPLLRQLLTAVAPRTTLECVFLLLVVSQLDAMVDFGAVATQMQAQPVEIRAVLLTGLVGLGLSSQLRTLVAFRDDAMVRWAWQLPLSSTHLAAAMGAAVMVRAAPVWVVGLLLGVWATAALALGTTMVVLAIGGRRWGLAALAALVTVAAGVFLPVLALPVLGLLPTVGRALRRSRTFRGRRVRTRWWGRTPILARVNRDLLAMWREAPWGWVALGFGTVLIGLAQGALVGGWSDAAIGSGGIVFAALAAPVAAGWGVTLADRLGAAWIPLHEALSPGATVGAQLVSVGLPFGMLWGAQTAAGAVDVVGPLRWAVLHGFFAMLVVWELVSRGVSRRRHAQGDVVTAAVFVGLLNWAGGVWAALPTAVLSMMLGLDARRRMRCWR